MVLAERVATYLINKAIEPTVENINEYIRNFMKEQQSQEQDKVFTPDDLIEIANKESAKLAGIQVAKNHIDALMHIRSELNTVNDEELLSTNINRISGVPDQIHQQISNLQTKFQNIINAVAVKIEDNKYKSSEEAVEDMQKRGIISAAQKNLTQQLVSADKQLHISCQSLKVTVDFFTSLNEHMVQEIEECKNTDQEYRLVLGNAILVYELANFVIKYLQSFETKGISEIKAVESEIDRKIQKIKTEIKELKNKAQNDKIFPEVKQNILSNVVDREEAVKTMRNAWDDYLGEVKTLSGETDSFVGKWLPNIELIRDDAKNQITTLDAVAIVKVLRGNLNALNSVGKSIKAIPLVSLSPDRVRRLLGIDKKG
jgi:inorganic pyrophosphatase